MKPFAWFGMFVCAAALNAGTLYKDYQETISLNPTTAVSIQNENGNIEVESWTEDSVEVIADIEVKGSNRRKAETVIDQARIRIDKSAHRLLIKPDYPNQNSGWHFFSWLFGGKTNVTVTLRLRVPKTCPLDVESVNGEVSLEGFSEKVRARSTNGRVSGENLSGPVDLKTVNGGIDVEMTSAELKADCHVETVNGTISVSMPGSFKADIDASTVNGDVQSDFEIAVKQISKNHLRGRLNGGGPRIVLQTVNGGIQIVKE
jgi:DUF4097 and DUF4098 domain-containing protein YvlB